MKGYVQVYTGNGKGKTTCALGLAFRASGRKFKTYFGQFMKAQHCGEMDAIAANPYITLERFGSGRCFRKENVTPQHIEEAKEALTHCKQALNSGEYQIVIMDEVNVAVNFGLIPVEDVLELIKQKPEDVELVLTGRNAHEKVIEQADLVSEIQEVKHYFKQGVPAREGIEY